MSDLLFKWMRMYLLCKARVVLGFLLIKSYVLKNQDLQSRAH